METESYKGFPEERIWTIIKIETIELAAGVMTTMRRNLVAVIECVFWLTIGQFNVLQIGFLQFHNH